MKPRKDESPEFIAFWSLWKPHARNTDGRGLARETFSKHVLNGANPQDIIDGAAWFLRNLNERTRDFVPLSATWLNREAYVDFAESERAFQAKQAEMAEKRASNVVRLPEPEKIITPEERARVAARMAELARSFGKREA